MYTSYKAPDGCKSFPMDEKNGLHINLVGRNGNQKQKPLFQHTAQILAYDSNTTPHYLHCSLDQTSQ